MSNNNLSSQESKPQKESNEDKGKHDLYKNSEPQKKPNAEPDHPLSHIKKAPLSGATGGTCRLNSF